MSKRLRGFAAAIFSLAAIAGGTPAYAADIAFERSNAIYAADAAGGNLQQVFAPETIYGSTYGYKGPQVSNSGTHVAAWGTCGGYCNGVLVAPISNPSVAHEVRGLDSWQFRDVRWTPMDDRLVYSLNPNMGRGYDIYSTKVLYDNGSQGWPVGTPYAGREANGGYEKNIVIWNGDQRRPHFSGNGSKLVFDSTSNASGVAYADGQPRIFITNADGSSPREVAVGTDPAISPNGASIVFQKPPKSGAPTQIYSVPAAGGTPVRLTSNKFTDSQPEWTADGAKVLFTRCNPTCGLFTMTPTGGSQAQLVANAQAGAGRQARVGTDLNVALEKYVPQLRYDSQEQFFADSAAMMTDNYSAAGSNTLMRQDGTVLANANPAFGGSPLSLDFLTWPTYSSGAVSEYTDKIDAVNNYQADAQRMHADPTYRNQIYSRVKQDASGKAWLQYWFFYYNNPYDVVCCGLGVHEGDWEMIQVGLNTSGTPDALTYSQHTDDDAEACTWSQVEKWLSPTGQVPVVYVARGSHASYTAAGDHNLASYAVQDEADGQGVPVQPTATPITDTSPSWVKWQGQWGGSETSPRGPSEQGNKWTAPDAFHNQAGSCEGQGGVAAVRSPSAPVIEAHADGAQVNVSYRFARLPKGRSRPRKILFTVHPKKRWLAPSATTQRVRARSGGASVKLPLGAGPYTVKASAFTRSGARSRVVAVRAR